MISQRIKAIALTISLCTLSVGGTLALFSAVPWIAQLASAIGQPKPSAVPLSDARATSPGYYRTR